MMEYYNEKLIRCPICNSMEVKQFEHGTWLLKEEWEKGEAPLPHYACISRHVFSIGDVR
jgi:hypothetical protein